MATADVYQDSIASIELPTRPPEECTLLVVDDDDMVLEFLVYILSREGYRIVTATNGYDTLERVKDTSPDVVVLDVLIPGIDGIAVCQQIKSADATRFLPVILVTGHTEQNRRMEGLAAGADEFLNKPLDRLELVVRVRTLLRSKQLYDELEAHRRELEERVEQRTHELREANKRLQELSKVKGRVLDIVSHELRTPAMQAKMAFEALNHASDDEAEQAQMFRRVDEAFAKLEYRLGQIRDFSDPTDLKPSLVAVSDVVRHAAARAARLHPDAASRLKIGLQPGLPPVYADGVKLAKALMQLIDNGLKFGRPDAVEVTAAVINGQEDTRISVRDYGPGMTQEQFFRATAVLEQGEEDPSTRHFGGFGIGLALAKMILDAHGVELVLEAASGRGVRATFVLPRANF